MTSSAPRRAAATAPRAITSTNIDPRLLNRGTDDRTTGFGRQGFLVVTSPPLTIDVLSDAIRRVAHGGTVVDPAIVDELVTRTGAAGQLAGLSDREREVLGLIAEGLRRRDRRRVAAVLAYLRATLVR